MTILLRDIWPIASPEPTSATLREGMARINRWMYSMRCALE
jgi:hypothetical protein